MPKQPNGTPGKKPLAPDRLPTKDNSLRAIATTVLEVFLAGMRYDLHGAPTIRRRQLPRLGNMPQLRSAAQLGGNQVSPQQSQAKPWPSSVWILLTLVSR
jgi:hypothetical protein